MSAYLPLSILLRDWEKPNLQDSKSKYNTLSPKSYIFIKTDINPFISTSKEISATTVAQGCTTDILLKYFPRNCPQRNEICDIFFQEPIIGFLWFMIVFYTGTEPYLPARFADHIFKCIFRAFKFNSPVNITVLDGTVPVLLYGRNWYCSDTVFPVHGIEKVPNGTVLHIVPIPSSTVYRYRLPDSRYKHGTGQYRIGKGFWYTVKSWYKNGTARYQL